MIQADYATLRLEPMFEDSRRLFVHILILNVAKCLNMPTNVCALLSGKLNLATLRLFHSHHPQHQDGASESVSTW